MSVDLQTQKEQILAYLAKTWPHESKMVIVKIDKYAHELCVFDAQCCVVYNEEYPVDPLDLIRKSMSKRLNKFKNQTKYWYYNRYQYNNPAHFTEKFPYLSTWIYVRANTYSVSLMVGDFHITRYTKSTIKHCWLVQKYFKDYEDRHIAAAKKAFRVLPLPISQAIIEHY